MIALSTGVRVPYVEQGDAEGVPMLLLHGYSDSLHSFDLLLPQLPDSIHAFAFDQRGHGDADRPEDGYTPADYAADALAFMDAVGLERAVVVGHSGGSVVAQYVAAARPERVPGLVLVGAFPKLGGNPAVAELLEGVEALTDPVDPGFVREFQESCLAQPIPAGFLDAIVAESRKLPARVWKSYLRAFAAADAAAGISAPTLIQWGDRDAICRRGDQDALLAAIPGARLEVYEGTGHCPYWEQPVRAASELAAFAARLAAPVW